MMSKEKEKLTPRQLIVYYREQLNKVLEIYNTLKIKGCSQETLEILRFGAQAYASLCDLWVRIKRSNERG